MGERRCHEEKELRPRRNRIKALPSGGDVILKNHDLKLNQNFIETLENKKFDTLKRVKFLLERAIELEKQVNL